MWVMVTYISQSSDFIFLFSLNIIHVLWDNEYDTTFELIINVGHSVLYFMVQWFCFKSWKLSDGWTSFFEIVWHKHWPHNKCRSVTYVLGSSDFVSCLEECFMDERHTLGKWISVMQWLTLFINVGDSDLYFMVVILPYYAPLKSSDFAKFCIFCFKKHYTCSFIGKGCTLSCNSF